MTTAAEKQPDTRTDAELRAAFEHAEVYSPLFKMFPDHPVEIQNDVLRWKKFSVRRKGK